jgi:aminocarboxymuconate-semialdehyde decarboxylase
VAKTSHTAGRPPRIDVHTHVAFPEILAMARSIKVHGSGPGKRDWVPAESRQEHARQTSAIDDKLTDPRARLADMKAMGVDMQVVSMNLPTPCYWANGRQGAEIARACNRLMAEFVNAMPERYVGIGVVALQDMGTTLKELDYLVHEFGLRGVQIPSSVRNHDLGEAHFRPFWARLEALGIPAIVHPRGFTHDDRLHKFFLWNSIGQPLEEALAMASLIHEGILDAYPKVKIVISHGGGYLPFYPGRSDKAFESRPEVHSRIGKKPSAYMRSFFYDSVIFDRDMLPALVKRVGAGRIMMGSDYPRGEIETDPVGFVSKAGLPAADRDKILSGNAQALFGIKMPAAPARGTR